MLQEKKSQLQEYSKEFIAKLKHLHINIDKSKIYPRDSRFESAIFDSSFKQIFATSQTTLKLDRILYLDKGMIHLVNIPESYYLGSKYIVVKIKDDEIWLRDTKHKIIIIALFSFIFMSIIGFFLLRLFLKPMRDAIKLLDRFIKDTTHELNTPVSTIVANIEMIDKSTLDDKLLKKINRIDIGAKTISNIYQDLTYITLSNKIISNDETLHVEQILKERAEYFKSLANAKKVTLSVDVKESTTLHVDRVKFAKLLDNLISNAIKYNKIGGSISLHVEDKKVVIEDSGIGIAEENISKLQDRYSRFNSSSGGFGIGLNIVATICKEYNIDIQISSKQRVGTKVSLSW
jgi:two-component system OmpR family sensor kinase